jgi:ribosomal subunit interface protein
MRTTVTARHCEIPAELRQRTTELVEKLSKAAHRPHSAEVVFDANHGRKLVELKLQLARGRTRVATAEADDFRSALDRVVDKVRNQLDKNAGRPERRPSA